MHLINPSQQLVNNMEQSEIDYMLDRMKAIQNRLTNPEGVELEQIGNVHCFYSKTMPWSTFNTVKGIRSSDIKFIDEILDFYRLRDRKVQFEIIPSLVDQKFLQVLSDKGFYQSGFHTSLYITPKNFDDEYHQSVRIEELKENDFETYATIHCRGTGLPDEGIPYVAENNRVLYNRPGWKFFIAYLNNTPAATGVMFMKDKLASLTFAATLPDFRNQGLQLNLLKKRIEEANTNNCELIVSQCSFLSQSHRNMERIGMKIGYVRTTWTER